MRPNATRQWAFLFDLRGAATIIAQGVAAQRRKGTLAMLNQRRRGLAWAATALALSAPIASGQCGGRWIFGPEQGVPGVHGEVMATVTFDPDGPGPLPELFVVGGSIDAAGTRRVGGVAAWDGGAWHSIGPGENHLATSLTAYNGELIAGGLFDGQGVVRWDGAAWQPVGEIEEVVTAMAAHNGELVAACQTGPSAIKAWNGETWRSIGDGHSTGIRSLLSLNGRLYAAGGFGIRSWDGETWGPLWPAGDAMTVHDGSLHAAGPIGDWFDVVWRLGPGGATQLVGMTGDIYGLGSVRGELWACGNLYIDGAPAPTSVAAWDGASWRAIAGTFDDHALAVTPLGDDAIVTGLFFSVNGVGMEHVARWDGQGWLPLGPGIAGTRDPFGNSAPVLALAPDDHGLTLGGAIIGPDGSRYVASWDGASIAGLDGGFAPSAPFGRGVQCAVAYADGVVVGGFITRAGDQPVNYIAYWDGDEWRSMGAGLNGVALALAVYQGDLICGGEFTTAGGVPVGGLARWDGVSWSAFGDLRPEQGYVRTLLADNDLLYAAGDLHVGEGEAWRLARWDGTHWTQIGQIDSPLTAVAKYQGELVVGGGSLLVVTPEGQVLTGLARWDGAGWRPVGDRGTGGSCHALQIVGDSLFVAGSGVAIIGGETHHIARFDGVQWHALDGPVVGYGFSALAHTHAELIVGGDTFRFPATERASARWARWSQTGTPWVARQPVAQGASVGGDATFHVTPASGYDFDGPLTFEWRRAGVPIANGPGGAAPGGGTVSGAGTPTLMITGVQPVDAGAYSCVIANGCGGATSDPAALFVAGACAADANGDGFIDFLDLNIVLSFYGQALAALPGDLDRDGDCDFVDLNIVLSAFGTAC